MKIIVEGSPKEMAALVLELREQPESFDISIKSRAPKDAFDIALQNLKQRCQSRSTDSHA